MIIYTYIYIYVYGKSRKIISTSIYLLKELLTQSFNYAYHTTDGVVWNVFSCFCSAIATVCGSTFLNQYHISRNIYKLFWTPANLGLGLKHWVADFVSGVSAGKRWGFWTEEYNVLQISKGYRRLARKKAYWYVLCVQIYLSIHPSIYLSTLSPSTYWNLNWNLIRSHFI